MAECAEYLLVEGRNVNDVQDDEDYAASLREVLEGLELVRPMFFDDLALRFRNRMHEIQARNYEVAELIAFETELRNVSQGF